METCAEPTLPDLEPELIVGTMVGIADGATPLASLHAATLDKFLKTIEISLYASGGDAKQIAGLLN